MDRTSAVTFFLFALTVGVIGFVAHRASLCTVRAVAEVLHARTANVLASFIKAALWAALVYGALILFLSPEAARFPAIAPRPLALAGGFVFGIGAAINGGCSYSTLQRIADGDVWGLTTLAGMALGVVAFSVVNAWYGIAQTMLVPTLWIELGSASRWLLAVLAVLGAIELWRLWRSRDRARTWVQRARATQYRVATAALIMGICAGLLYGLLGPWSYTGTLRRAVDAGYRQVALLDHTASGPNVLQWSLFAALLAGMVVSSVQRGSFALRWQHRGQVPARLAGGALMGVGASLVPGGNDTLILTGLPALSVQMLFAYVALVAGIGCGLLLLRRLGATLPAVRCVGGVCIEQKA
jgi:uncharacterized membrane protein YedE/YeeE